jgi:hypothetical protein
MSSKSVNMPCTVLNPAVLTAKDTTQAAHPPPVQELQLNPQ